MLATSPPALAAVRVFAGLEKRRQSGWTRQRYQVCLSDSERVQAQVTGQAAREAAAAAVIRFAAHLVGQVGADWPAEVGLVLEVAGAVTTGQLRQEKEWN